MRRKYALDLATGQMFSRLISLLRLFALFTVDESALRDLLCARFNLTTEAVVALTCIVMKCFGFCHIAQAKGFSICFAEIHQNESRNLNSN